MSFGAALAVIGDPRADCSLLYSSYQSVVFLARMPSGSRAIVKLPSDELIDSEFAQYRLRNEADVLRVQGLRERRRVPMLYHVDPQGRFLVREFIRGSTIQDVALMTGSARRAQLLPALLCASSTLFHAFHGARPEALLIRDLKPKNLVVAAENDDHTVLVDVGSVRPAGHQAAGSKKRVRLGTRRSLYSSPELLISHGLTADEASDFFSLGATAFYLLFARAPYSNSESNPARAVDRYLSEYGSVQADWLEACKRWHVAQTLARFVAYCLHPLPAVRPKTHPDGFNGL